MKLPNTQKFGILLKKIYLITGIFAYQYYNMCFEV